MKIQAAKWPSDPKTDCIKTLAERILELTNKYSIDSYRHRTLSTPDKAKEFYEWVIQVRERVIPKATLGPMIEEYDNSLATDPIVEYICNDRHIPIESLRIKTSYPLERMLAALYPFNRMVLPNYQNACIDLIFKTAQNKPSNKHTMMLLSEHLIPHLISQGKSREFIHLSAKREFFICPDEISAEHRMQNFFSTISREIKRYEVLIECENGISEYIGRVLSKEPLDWKRLPNYFKYSVTSKKRRYIQLGYKGNDPFDVASNVKFFTELLQSFSIIFPSKEAKSTISMMYTFDEETGEVFRVPPDVYVNMGPVTWDEKKRENSVKSLMKFSLGIRSDPDDDSTLQIVNALITASSASRITDQNSCLASIWSAFEALLPAPMKDGEKSTRITHFADIITPLATTTYAHEFFYGLYSELTKKEFRSEFYSFVDRHGVGSNRFEKFVSVFFLEENLKKEFTNIFSDRHVLRIRAMSLEKIANSPSELRKALEGHDKRVLWQIHRIYRERNNIMHKASSSKYSRSLVENTFSYFKGTIMTLIRASEKYGIRDVDGLIELCLALRRNYEEELKGYQEKDGKEALFYAIKGYIR